MRRKSYHSEAIFEMPSDSYLVILRLKEWQRAPTLLSMALQGLLCFVGSYTICVSLNDKPTGLGEITVWHLKVKLNPEK